VLGHLSLLDHHLALLESALAAAHSAAASGEALTHQARSMVQVARILRLQIEAYEELVAARLVPPSETARRRS